MKDIPPERNAPTESNVTISRIDDEYGPRIPKATPPLWHNVTAAECRKFFIEHYCRQNINTFDGLEVRFSRGEFKHAFFESPKKVEFSISRAERVRWIEYLLADPNAILLQGFDNKTATYNPQRRVALWPDEAYLAIIQLHPIYYSRAYFITAFRLSGGTADRTLSKLLASPLWSARNT